jgi:hypothetical protein
LKFKPFYGGTVIANEFMLHFINMENFMLKNLLRALFVCLAVIIPLGVYATPLTVENIYHNWRFPADDHRYRYASSVDFFDVTADGVSRGVWIADPNGSYGGIYPSMLSWGHTLPIGLQVPPDSILKAKLFIDASFVDENDNLVEIEGIWDWDPLQNEWWDNSIYDLAKVDVPGFWNNSPLDVSVFAYEKKLRIDQAVLMMDYRGQATIPEPATFALFGLGMAGFGLIRRKK